MSTQAETSVLKDYECTFKFFIKGDHPVNKRIDERDLEYEEASKLVSEMMFLGYENIEIKHQ